MNSVVHPVESFHNNLANVLVVQLLIQFSHDLAGELGWERLAHKLGRLPAPVSVKYTEYCKIPLRRDGLIHRLQRRADHKHVLHRSFRAFFPVHTGKQTERWSRDRGLRDQQIAVHQQPGLLRGRRATDLRLSLVIGLHTLGHVGPVMLGLHNHRPALRNLVHTNRLLIVQSHALKNQLEHILLPQFLLNLVSHTLHQLVGIHIDHNILHC
mmetsp:Transcript_30256/g.78158  ORF Transcript_30256/g.78158 Transcript_30256/m.78158 type:complete len:211 (-) Transcript_30256:79-711(-)